MTSEFGAENLWIGVEDEGKASEAHKQVDRLAKREEYMGTYLGSGGESMIININSQRGHLP